MLVAGRLQLLAKSSGNLSSQIAALSSPAAQAASPLSIAVLTSLISYAHTLLVPLTPAGGRTVSSRMLSVVLEKSSRSDAPENTDGPYPHISLQTMP